MARPFRTGRKLPDAVYVTRFWQDANKSKATTKINGAMLFSLKNPLTIHHFAEI
jgi:hypothetical protein